MLILSVVYKKRLNQLPFTLTYTRDMASKRRHKNYSDEQIKQKHYEATPASTLKCDKKWTKIFRDYLEEKDCENTEFWTYPEDELGTILSKFWFEV